MSRANNNLFCHSQSGFSLAKNPEGSWPCKSSPLLSLIPQVLSLGSVPHQANKAGDKGAQKSLDVYIAPASQWCMNILLETFFCPQHYRSWTLFFHSASDRQTGSFSTGAQTAAWQQPLLTENPWHTRHPTHFLANYSVFFNERVCAGAGANLSMNPLVFPSSF